jgi:hypothetical protein
LAIEASERAITPRRIEDEAMPKRCRKPKQLLIDRIGPTLEQRSRAWLAAHPTPPGDEEDFICWQALTNYVSLLDEIRAQPKPEPQR